MNAQAISTALASFQRRAVVVKTARIAIATAGLALLIAEVAALRPDLLGARVLAVVVAVAVAGMLTGAVYAWRTMPSPLDAGRRVDRIARLNDLTVTAIGRAGRDDELSAVIMRSARAEIQHVRPAAVYPLEVPGHWRQWAILAAAVQIVALGLVWQAPANRPIGPSSASLSIPGGGSGTPGQAAAPSKEAPSPTTNPTAGSERARQAADGASPAPAPTSAAPFEGAAGSATGGARTPDASPSDVIGDATAAGASRYRQAAARAGDVVAQGRVPAALRGVVERYFAAIRQQEKR